MQENPKEVAEAIMILANTWLNPLVEKTDEQGMRERCNTFNSLLRGIGIDTLLDEELIRCKDVLSYPFAENKWVDTSKINLTVSSGYLFLDIMLSLRYIAAQCSAYPLTGCGKSPLLFLPL